MTKDFLKPRFKLIADYPGNSQPVGNITIEDATASYFRKFPANFKELKWYEEREPNEMPLFIKNKTSIPVTYTKVDYWKQIKRKDLGSYVQLLMVVNGKENDINFWAIEPATEEEYLLSLTGLL